MAEWPTLRKVDLQLLQMMLCQALGPVLLLALQQALLGHQPFPAAAGEGQAMGTAIMTAAAASILSTQQS